MKISQFRRVLCGALLCALFLCAGLPAHAATYIWNLNANGSWGTDGNWNISGTPGPGHIVDLGTVTTADRILTMNGDYTIASLQANHNQNFTINSSPAFSMLGLESGDMALTFSAVNKRLTMNTVFLRVGDGINPVTATWTLNNSTATTNANSNAPNAFGAIYGALGSTITLNGSGGSALFKGPNSTYAGNWTFNFGLDNGGTPGYRSQVFISATNAMGTGMVSTTGTTSSIVFNRESHSGATTELATTHDMALQLNATTTGITLGGWGSAVAALPTVVTLNGALTGSGALTLGAQTWIASSAYRNGVLLLTNANNTLSGAVTVTASELRVNGTWTGAGNISVTGGANTSSSLTGTGTINLASNSIVMLAGASNSSADDWAGRLAPGTDARHDDPTNNPGTIGTLAINTAGTGRVRIGSTSGTTYGRLKMDLSSTTAGLSDLLAIGGTGAFELASGGTQFQYLYLSVVDGDKTTLNGNYTLATFTTWTGATAFDNVYFNGVLVADPTALNSIGGTHHLVYGTNSLQVVSSVPEPGTITLALLGTIGVVYLGRRRMRR